MTTTFTRFALAGALLAAPTAVSAHATLEVASAPANSTYKAVLRIPHGCDGHATHTVTLELPEGFIAAKPMPKPGWDLTITKGEFAKTYDYYGRSVSDGPVTIEWSGGSLDDAHYDEFVVRGRITDFPEGTVLAFPTTQTCTEGEVAWAELAAPGQDPHDLARPAPLLTVSNTGVAGHASHASHASTAKADASGQAVMAGDLMIEGAWVRATPPGAPVGGGYLTITNTGDSEDRLIGGAASFATLVEIHEMEMDGGVMRMQPIDGGLVIAPGATEVLQPGGNHVMFMGLTEAIEHGDPVIATLVFQNAGEVTVVFTTAPIGAMSPDGHGDHSAHGDHGGHSDHGSHGGHTHN